MSAILAYSRRGGAGAARATPHLSGGSDLDKVLYEYQSPDSIWDLFDRFDLKGLDVVDVGCGWGGKAIRYAEQESLASLVGFDMPGSIDPAVMTAFARDRGLTNCTFLEALAEAQPFEDESFDVAIIDDVLEHVEDPEEVLRETFRVLRPGGRILVKFPSIRMALAHHLDRAVPYPGVHFLLPLRTWASGLNYCLVESDGELDFEPFDEVRATRFHRAVPCNLNGQSFNDFRGIVDRSGFEVETLHIVPIPIEPSSGLRKSAAAARDLASHIPGVRERLGVTIAFAGRRPR